MESHCSDETVPEYLQPLVARTQDCQYVITSLFKSKRNPPFPSSLAFYTICGILYIQLGQIVRTAIAQPVSDPNLKDSPPDPGFDHEFVKRCVDNFLHDLCGIQRDLETHYQSWTSTHLRGVAAHIVHPSKPAVFAELTKKLEADHTEFTNYWYDAYHRDMLLKHPNHLENFPKPSSEGPRHDVHDIDIPAYATFNPLRSTEFEYHVPNSRFQRTLLRSKLSTTSEPEELRSILEQFDCLDHVLTSSQVKVFNAEPPRIYYDVPYWYLTLQELLEHPIPEGHAMWPSLSDRVRVALQVVHAVIKAKAVHGSISPAHIFMPRSFTGSASEPASGSDLAVGTPLLAGFNHLRRFVDTPRTKMDLVRDIRSLGLVLVAIALWKDPVPDAYAKSSKANSIRWENAVSQLNQEGEFKQKLVKELDDVAFRVGSRYAKATKFCLEVRVCLYAGLGIQPGEKEEREKEDSEKMKEVKGEEVVEVCGWDDMKRMFDERVYYEAFDGILV